MQALNPTLLNAVLKTGSEPVQHGTPDGLDLFSLLLSGVEAGQAPQQPPLNAHTLAPPDGEPLPDSGNPLPLEALAEMLLLLGVTPQDPPQTVVPVAMPMTMTPLPKSAGPLKDLPLKDLPVEDLPRLVKRLDTGLEKVLVETLARKFDAHSPALETPAPRADLATTALMARQPSLPTPAPPAPTPVVHAHPQTPRFAGELGDTVLRLVRDGISEAEIRLNPADLGPLKLSIRVRDDAASLILGAQNPQTREALEAALPRLRELFAEQGLQLTDASVGDGRDAHRAGQGTGLFAGDTAGDSGEADATGTTAREAQGLLDVFA